MSQACYKTCHELDNKMSRSSNNYSQADVWLFRRQIGPVEPTVAAPPSPPPPAVGDLPEADPSAHPTWQRGGWVTRPEE